MKIIATTALILTLSASAWAVEMETSKQAGELEIMKPVVSETARAPDVLNNEELGRIRGGLSLAGSYAGSTTSDTQDLQDVFLNHVRK